MTSTLIVRDTLPKKDFSSITQLGLKALNLALSHAAALTPRLPRDMLKGLAEDLQSLGVVVPGAKQARVEAMSATTTQNAALQQGYSRVLQIRAAIRRAKAPAEVQHAYGVGVVVRAHVVRDVKAAIQQIVDRANLQPDEAASFGILRKDIDALTLALEAITDADTKQEQKRASAPLSTRERNRTANRILAAVARIEGSGRMEFAHDATTRASFEELGKGPAAKRKSKAVGMTPQRGTTSP